MVRLHIENNGSKYWMLLRNVTLFDNAVHLHRDNGPAVLHLDAYTSSEWWFRGLRHRETGPAVVYINGLKSWYWFGKRVDEYEHMMLAAKNSND